MMLASNVANQKLNKNNGSRPAVSISSLSEWKPSSFEVKEKAPREKAISVSFWGTLRLLEKKAKKIQTEQYQF